jgi:hypothetical protein
LSIESFCWQLLPTSVSGTCARKEGLRTLTSPRREASLFKLGRKPSYRPIFFWDLRSRVPPGSRLAYSRQDSRIPRRPRDSSPGVVVVASEDCREYPLRVMAGCISKAISFIRSARFAGQERKAHEEIASWSADDARQRRRGSRAADRVVQGVRPPGRARSRRAGGAIRRRDRGPGAARAADMLGVR